MATQLLKIDQVSQRLALSRSQVYALISEGRILYVKIGRSVRVSESVLENFIRARTVRNGKGDA